MAQEFAEPDANTDPYPRLASFDSNLNQVNFIKEYERLGHSASLVQAPDNLYVGSSYSQNLAPGTPWHLAFMRIPNTELSKPGGINIQCKISIMSFNHDGCSHTSNFFINKNTAPYIRHIGYDDTEAPAKV